MTADKFEGMIRPEDLRQITEDKEMAELRQALEHKKKVEAEQKDVYQAFLNQHVHPEAKARVTAGGTPGGRARREGTPGDAASPASSVRTEGGRSTTSSRIGPKH